MSSACGGAGLAWRGTAALVGDPVGPGGGDVNEKDNQCSMGMGRGLELRRTLI